MSDKYAKLTLTQFKKFSDLPDVFIHTQLIIALPFPSTGADQLLKSDLIHKRHVLMTSYLSWDTTWIPQCPAANYLRQVCTENIL